MRICECGAAEPSFGRPGGARKDARWCSKCPSKPANSVNVKCNRCECGAAMPYFGRLGGKPKDAIWCSKCPSKPAEAVDVVSVRCDCGEARASFGKPGGARKDARWCSKCPSKPAEAIDVTNKKCSDAGCMTTAKFGSPGQQASRCAVHKLLGMILRPRMRCRADDCRELGTHLEGGGERRFCEAHAPEGSTDFVQRPCGSCGLPCVLGPEGRCAACDPVRRAAYVKAREMEVKSWLDAEGVRYVSHDKMLDGGVCDKKRPDFLFDAETHLVMVEVDERQHWGNSCECEQTRMVNLAQAGGMPSTFLRINPDGYKPLAGREVPLASRRESFIRWIRWLMIPGGEGDPSKRGAFCEARYLFFDGCDGLATPVSIGPRIHDPVASMTHERTATDVQ